MSHSTDWDWWIGYLFALIVLLVITILGGMCLFRTATVVRFLEYRNRTSKLARMELWSNQVSKPWYRWFIRFWGVLLWSVVGVVVLAIAGKI